MRSEDRLTKPVSWHEPRGALYLLKLTLRGIASQLIRSKETGQLEPATWDEAMNLIVAKSKELIEHYTPNSIAFYTSGQLFLEEYHTLAMIGKGGLGTLHMDGNTRLCTASAAASMRESFGCDSQPGSYTDFVGEVCSVELIRTMLTRDFTGPLRHASHGRPQHGRHPDRPVVPCS